MQIYFEHVKEIMQKILEKWNNGIMEWWKNKVCRGEGLFALYGVMDDWMAGWLEQYVSE